MVARHGLGIGSSGPRHTALSAERALAQLSSLHALYDFLLTSKTPYHLSMQAAALTVGCTHNATPWPHSMAALHGRSLHLALYAFRPTLRAGYA